MEDGGLEIQGYFTRLSMIWDQMTRLWVSAPTRPAGGDLCALLWFYTGYVRLCYEKGAMSSCWKYAGFCGYFLFFPGSPFDFYWDPFCCWSTLHSWRIISATLPVLFDLTIIMTYYYFCGGLLNYLHLYISNHCAEGTQLLEDFMLKKDWNY